MGFSLLAMAPEYQRTVVENTQRHPDPQLNEKIAQQEKHLHCLLCDGRFVSICLMVGRLVDARLRRWSLLGEQREEMGGGYNPRAPTTS